VNGVYQLAEKWTAPVTDKIVCVADAMRDQSLAAGIGKPEQYVTVYSGMATGPFIEAAKTREEVRRRLGFAEGDLVVGTIARLFELKGHEDLLELAPKLCAELPDLRFLWVGDGLLRDEFERRMREMGLRERFVLTGLVPPGKVAELTGAMDILVHPSRREGLARALPQAALAGKPAITYDIDGAKEAVVEGKTGYVISPFDIGRLGEAIAKLAGDSALRQEMGLRGREFAMGRFDAEGMVEALEKVYSEVGKKL
jgi:glycosyltransferase involved in cell wall biosynthesis